MTADTEPILTERLVLRRLVEADAPSLAAIADDRRIARNLTTVFPSPYTLADAEGFIASGPACYAITVPSQGDELVGVVGGDSRDGAYDGVHSFGYWLGVDSWGNGYATEAAKGYVDHIIATRRPRRIEAMVYGWNPASGRVLEKVGLTLEGRIRSRVVRFGETTDELIYGMVLEP